MVNVTDNAHIPFPEPTDDLNTFADTLLEQAESLYADRELIPFSAVANWTVTRCEAQPILGDGFYYLICDFTYTGAAAINAGDASSAAPGNIGNTQVTTFGAFAPGATQHGIVATHTQSGGSAAWFMVLTSAGQLQLSHGPTSGKITTGATFQIRHLIHRVA